MYHALLHEIFEIASDTIIKQKKICELETLFLKTAKFTLTDCSFAVEQTPKLSKKTLLHKLYKIQSKETLRA